MNPNVFLLGQVVELVDTLDLGSSARKGVWVRVPPWSQILRGRAVVARKAHNLEVGGSNPSPATKLCFVILKLFISIMESH